MIGRRSSKHRDHHSDYDDVRDDVVAAGGHNEGDDASMNTSDPSSREKGGGDAGEASAFIAELQAQLAELSAERDQLKDSWMQEAAELRNFRRRAAEAEAEARRQSLAGVLRNLVPIIDHMDMGLDQASNAQNIEQVLGGVRSIRDEFVRVLESFGVSIIRPNPGDEPDPLRHQVLTFQPSPDIQPGRISAVFRPGYAIGDRVIRPAEVIVAAEPSSA